MNNFVIYTCLVGAYDDLIQPLIVDERFDYICFSNDFNVDKIGVWLIKKIPYDNLDCTRLSRFVKLMPHLCLQNYEYSLYIDSNIQITKASFYDKIIFCINKGSLISQVAHNFPICDCIYDEIKCCVKCGKISLRQGIETYKKLKKTGFPSHYGLWENNIIFRRHHNEVVKRISLNWWNEYCNGTHRDQLSLAYVYWKNNFVPDLILDSSIDARHIDIINVFPHNTMSKNFVEKFSYKLKTFISHHVKVYIYSLLIKLI